MTKQHSHRPDSPRVAALYERMLTDGQEENNALEPQDAAYRAYAEARG